MKNLKNKIKNIKGITLISLVITVIVLIILAGITLNMLLGENDLINKTKTARDENEKATATETMNLKITNVQMSKYAEEQRMPTLKELADNFCEDNDFQYVQETSKVASLTKISNENPTSIYTKLKAYPYEFEINSSLQLASINGVKVATVPENDGDSIVSMTKLELDSYIETKFNEIESKLSDTTIYNGTVKNNSVAASTETLLNEFKCPKKGKVIVSSFTKTSSTTAVSGQAFYYKLKIRNNDIFAGQTHYWPNNWCDNYCNMSAIVEVNKDDVIELKLWSAGATSHDVNELHIKYLEVCKE